MDALAGASEEEQRAVSESPESASARRHFVNDPRRIVPEALAGFERANRALVRWNREPSFIVRADDDRPDRVGVLSGGGSGHEPLHTGFVGRGMLDAAVPGAIFASPTALQVAGATAAIDRGLGVVHIVKNYTGDVMNFGMAAEMTGIAGIAVESVLVDDDVATDSVDGPGRRGTAAVIAVEKICGAAAARGASLKAVAELGRRVAAGARSMAVALHAPTHPGQTRPSFDLEPGEIELGVGIHGERGVGRRSHAPASELAEALLDPVATALDLRSGERALVIVNGLGATPGLELHVMFAEAARLLDRRGVAVERVLVGPYVTSLDMSGCSLTLVRLDDELVELWDAPVRTPALTW
jgi:phosphoenolpyruvate---glycerone phosphotransferase subunit DhaK